MATVTSFLTGVQEHEILQGYKGTIKNTLNFSATNVSAADVVQALKVGAGMLITKVHVKVDTAEGGTSTNDIGDGTDPNGYDASVNFNATADTVTSSLEATDAYGPGKYYSADDTIDITVNNALNAAIVTITAEYTRLTT